ncbi:hypothetical protein [Vulcanisaeta distributa]|uniref:hypothetical protein n=1 Tax=Vulcanisaeta distributa TaxID=164451 RepID=UPI000AB42332|nr:hypothetical protein [Vulcanisaeta distributa]
MNSYAVKYGHRTLESPLPKPTNEDHVTAITAASLTGGELMSRVEGSSQGQSGAMN